MPTPYEHAPTAVLPTAARPRLERPLAGRWLGGVCVGIAEHLGLDPRSVRWAVAILGVLGPGVPAYLFLWAVAPAGTAERSIDPASGRPAPAVGRALAGLERSRQGAMLAVGLLVVAVGLLIALQGFGLDVRAGLLVPLLVIAAGAVVVWSDLDDSGRERALDGSTEGGRGLVWLRVGLGVVLGLVGFTVILTRGNSLSLVLDSLLASLAVLVGLAIISAPWALRLWTRTRQEQEAAARAHERADIAAHLHDSVLQTLAMIQRRSTDPAAVNALARAQERELRSWLYAGPVGHEKTLAAAIAGAAHEVEDLTSVAIDLVVTGDRPMEDNGAALVRAMREALLNAARHGAPPVTAYVEIGPAGVEAFVRDRGAGFDLDDVPEDRLGVRQSILGRMERHGGAARVRRREDGTEVELTLPALEGADS